MVNYVKEWLNVCRMVYGCVEWCEMIQKGAAKLFIYRGRKEQGWDNFR